MSQRPRVHTPAFKAQVAMAALKGDKIAKAWDVKTGTELLTLKGHTGKRAT